MLKVAVAGPIKLPLHLSSSNFYKSARSSHTSNPGPTRSDARSQEQVVWVGAGPMEVVVAFRRTTITHSVVQNKYKAGGSFCHRHPQGMALAGLQRADG